jgi:elongator complex protein 3
MKYRASDGTEFFISIDTDEDKLVGFCRMRFPDESSRPEIDGDSAIIRELHVNGHALALGKHGKSGQHKGYGKKLMAQAERIACEHHKNKMVVISGIGVRGYYRKLGYEREGPYMVKQLR